MKKKKEKRREAPRGRRKEPDMCEPQPSLRPHRDGGFPIAAHSSMAPLSGISKENLKNGKILKKNVGQARVGQTKQKQQNGKALLEPQRIKPL